MIFARYLSLGDSISIDEYPGLDHQERNGRAGPRPGLGAASLLYRNDDSVWPEFRGRDLATLCPGVVLQPLACDGATTFGVLEDQLRLLEPASRSTLVTLTIGGNDLLTMLVTGPSAEAVDEALVRTDAILDRLGRLYPESAVLLATVYDPSDGNAQLVGLRLDAQKRALLDRMNAGLRARCRGRVVLCDLAVEFLGHGLSAQEDERWYWRHSLIEPSVRGACEVRRLWLEALGA